MRGFCGRDPGGDATKICAGSVNILRSVEAKLQEQAWHEGKLTRNRVSCLTQMEAPSDGMQGKGRRLKLEKGQESQGHFK